MWHIRMPVPAAKMLVVAYGIEMICCPHPTAACFPEGVPDLHMMKIMRILKTQFSIED